MKNLSGFTLIELMVTLAVGIVILAIGVPSFMSMMSTNQAAGYANDLVGAIRLARSEAVKRGSDVAICAAKQGSPSECSSKDDLATATSDWNYGWLVFADYDSGNDQDPGEEVIRVWSIQDKEQDYLAFEGSSPGGIRFVPSGANALDAEIQFAFKKTDCHASQARQITISRMGRASLEHVACF